MNLIGWFSTYYLDMNFIQLLDYKEVKNGFIFFEKLIDLWLWVNKKGFIFAPAQRFNAHIISVKFIKKN
jgi:hypothetical protein